MSIGVDPTAIGTEVRIGRAGRKNRRTKALRLLVEGRVGVRVATPERALIYVKGDSGCVRIVEHDASGWQCDCPAARGRCAHVLAAQLVTLRPEAESSS